MHNTKNRSTIQHQDVVNYASRIILGGEVNVKTQAVISKLSLTFKGVEGFVAVHKYLLMWV